MTSYADDCWSALIEGLSSIGKVRGREPYGLVVTLPRPDGSVSTVEIVMTREDWLDVATVIHGDVRYAVEYARDVVQAEADSPYLVYDTYELVPSDTAELPPDPDLVAIQELASQYPDGVIPGGRWVPGPLRPPRAAHRRDDGEGQGRLLIAREPTSTRSATSPSTSPLA